MVHFKTALLCGAMALLPANAFAQEAPSAVANEGRTDAQPGDQAAPTSSGGTTLGAQDADAAASGDIVVTAQRRSERLTDVPIAITAITAERMGSAGIVQSTDLAAITPGLSFPTNGAFAQPVIRGVGTSLTGPGVDPNVAIYVDGVYQPNQSANIFNFNSVEQVEVLKGPQGTLFGRNATGGAITVRTLNPGFTPALRASAGYGRFNDARLNLYINVPLVNDQVAVNLAATYRKEDGFLYNVFKGRTIPGLEDYGFRPKILLQPSENFSLVLTGGYSWTSNARQLAFAPYRGNNTQNIRNPSLPRPRGPFEISANEDALFIVRNQNVSLRGELETEVGTLSAISAYIDLRNQLGVDGDSSAAASTYSAYVDTQKTFSQELNFASEKFGALSFIAGLFYYNDDAQRDLRAFAVSTGPATRRTVAGVKTEAWAAYSEVNFDVSDRLHLIGGLRYSREKKHARGVVTIASPPPAPLDSEKTFDGWTPRASIRYELSPSTNIYATYSKGFKSGAYNSVSLERVPVNQETVSAYEVGFKTSSPGFRFSASAFYYDYADIQVQTTVVTSVVVLQNAASAEIYGADADFSFDISPNFRIDGGMAYTHGRYGSYNGALLVSPTGPLGTNVQAVQPNGPGATGNPTARTPEFTANATLSYNQDVGAVKLRASATGSYNSGFNWQQDARIKEPAFFLLNGEISIANIDDNYRLTVWGRNLTNEIYANYQAQSAVGDQVIFDRPRTYGVTLGVNF